MPTTVLRAHPRISDLALRVLCQTPTMLFQPYVISKIVLIMSFFISNNSSYKFSETSCQTLKDPIQQTPCIYS